MYRAPGTASTESRELSAALSLGQGSLSANLEVSASEGFFWDFPLSLPSAKGTYHHVRPNSPFPPSPGSGDPQKLRWPPGRGCKGQAGNLLLACSQQLDGCLTTDLDQLTFFLQNPKFLSFCLIHQEPVAGGMLQEDQRKREGLPGRHIRPLWEGNIF